VQREEVAVGTATDPYQPAEGRFRLTRVCILELAAGWTPFSIVTRGPLVVRDGDVLQDASRRVTVGVFCRAAASAGSANRVPLPRREPAQLALAV